MNTGIVSMRYAKAFFRYTEERGSSERVCKQVVGLLKYPERTPDKLEEELQHFSAFLIKKGRISSVRFILRSYVKLYYESQGIMEVTLTTAVPAPELEKKLNAILSGRLKSRLIFETKVDPNLIGGFVVLVNGRMLDASVKRQIDQIRREFVIQNNRIV